MIKLTPEKPPYYEIVGQTKTYIALLTQTGTEIPTQIELKNTLGGPIIYTYEGPGNYKGTLTGAFPNNKIIFPANHATFNGADQPINIGYTRIGDNAFQISVVTFPDGNNAELETVNMPIEITIYN